MAAIKLDVSSLDSIQSAARELIENHPDLNVVFNNAGFMPFDDVSGSIDDAVAQDAPVPKRNIVGLRPRRGSFVRYRTKAVSTSLNYIGSSRFKVHPRRVDETHADMSEC
ncbi:hypothetical protein [Rhizobium sp. AN5]|uniref:hypothetical protein n=1 Tax=Rhizobium sp. AN5 TaxID=1855304 RepID=UPI000BE45BDA|nr:hypothetical protein [Rhizobium sp. AN5]